MDSTRDSGERLLQLSHAVAVFLLFTVVGAPIGLVLLLLERLIRDTTSAEARYKRLAGDLAQLSKSLAIVRSTMEGLADAEGLGETASLKADEAPSARHTHARSTKAPSNIMLDAPGSPVAAPAAPRSVDIEKDREDFLQSLDAPVTHARTRNGLPRVANRSGEEPQQPVEEQETSIFRPATPPALDPDAEAMQALYTTRVKTGYLTQLCRFCGAVYPDSHDRCPICNKPALKKPV